MEKGRLTEQTKKKYVHNLLILLLAIKECLLRKNQLHTFKVNNYLMNKIKINQFLIDNSLILISLNFSLFLFFHLSINSFKLKSTFSLA